MMGAGTLSVAVLVTIRTGEERGGHRCPFRAAWSVVCLLAAESVS